LDKKQKNNVEYNRLKDKIIDLYNKALKSKIKNWRNSGNFDIRIDDIDIHLLGAYICIRFFELPDYRNHHLHINSDGSFYNSEGKGVVSADTKILRMQYELLKKLIMRLI
jgi:hypothetical protein